MTLSQVRVTSASLPIERRCIALDYLNARRNCKNRVTFHLMRRCALTFTGNDGTLFCTAHQ